MPCAKMLKAKNIKTPHKNTKWKTGKCRAHLRCTRAQQNNCFACISFLAMYLRLIIPKTSKFLQNINNLTNSVSHLLRLGIIINTSFLYGRTLHILRNVHNKLVLSWDLVSQPRLSFRAWQPAQAKTMPHLPFTTGNSQFVETLGDKTQWFYFRLLNTMRHRSNIHYYVLCWEGVEQLNSTKRSLDSCKMKNIRNTTGEMHFPFSTCQAVGPALCLDIFSLWSAMHSHVINEILSKQINLLLLPTSSN